MFTANDVNLIGRFTADPEMIYTPNGTPITSFRVAVQRTGQKAREANDGCGVADFFQIQVVNRLAEVVNQLASKGDPVYVNGRLTVDTWRDQQNQPHERVYVIGNNVQLLSVRSAPADADPSGEGAELPAERW